MWEIYTKNNCPYCDKAKFLLREAIEKGEAAIMNISEDPAYFNALMIRNPNARTMPQIYKDNNLIGGFTELDTFLKLNAGEITL